MKVTFWGTRGSVARPGPTTLRYGGNTSCVEVRANDGTVVVIDIGTGAYELGRALLAEQDVVKQGHLLISHTHWDHVQGFPFFAPLFVPGWSWSIYAPRALNRQLEQTLAGQMSYEYFPIDLGALSASVEFHELGEGELDIGPFRVTTQYLNHPSVTLGYRLQEGGTTLVYSCDHEPAEPHPPDQPGRLIATHGEDQRHIRFLRAADLVIHDAQYTEELYLERHGWGHTPIERAVAYAIAAEASQLALTHHDPGHDDDIIDRLVDQACAIARDVGVPLRIFGAAEGQTIDLGHSQTDDGDRATTDTARTVVPASRRLSRVLVVDADPTMTAVAEAALIAEGYRVVVAANAEAALEEVRRAPPDLVLLDLQLPGMDGLELCRVLRQQGLEIPILLCTALATGTDGIARGFDAGVSDYIMKPFKPSYLRARVDGWLLRASVARSESEKP